MTKVTPMKSPRYSLLLSRDSIVTLCAVAMTLSFWLGQEVSQYLVTQHQVLPMIARHPDLSLSHKPRPALNMDWEGVAVPVASGDILQGLATSRNPMHYEFLVHPTMMAHWESSTSAVAIASNTWSSPESNPVLRQVLKHSTVQNVTLFVNGTRKMLVEIDNVTKSHRYISEHQSLKAKPDWIANATMLVIANTTKFDVVILENHAGLVDASLWMELLAEDGILVASLHHLRHARERVQWIERLVQAGFKAAIDYEVWIPSWQDEEDNQNFAPSSAVRGRLHHYAVAFKNETTKALWHRNEALYNRRMLVAARGKKVNADAEHEPHINPLSSWFDGATMTALEYPSKKSEHAYCRYGSQVSDDEFACRNEHGIDPSVPNVPRRDLRVSKSGVGDGAGRGVFTSVDIPVVGTYLDVESTAHPVRAPWTTTEIALAFMNYTQGYNETGEPLVVYLDAYGFLEESSGFGEYVVDSALATFVNHGCNGTNNIGNITADTELTVDIDQPPVEFMREALEKYNPQAERDPFKDHTVAATSKVVLAGEEILDNYLFFGGEESFKEQVTELREQCGGMGVGMVEKYQDKRRHAEVNVTRESTLVCTKSGPGPVQTPYYAHDNIETRAVT